MICFFYTIVKWVGNGEGRVLGVLLQKLSGLNGVKSGVSRQDKHRNTFPQKTGIGNENFCDDFEKEKVEKRWPFHNFWTSKWIENFQTFTLYECKILANEAKQKKNIIKRLTQFLDPFFYIFLPIKPNKEPHLLLISGVQTAGPPPLDAPWIRSV